jgi:putative transport protein
MEWMKDLLFGTSAEHAIFIISLVIVVGVSFGKIKIFGTGLGATGVLFAGLTAGHFHLMEQTEILDFIRDMGLIFFVFSIGLDVGPGFVASFKKQGVRLNAFASLIVVTGVLISGCVWKFSGLSPEVVIGILRGSVTNTPSLGAVQQILKEQSVSAALISQTGMAYAMTYPVGIFGVIFSMIFFRILFRIDVKQEAGQFEKEQSESVPSLSNFNLIVRNPRLIGASLNYLSSLVKGEFVVSRLLREGEVHVAVPESILQSGDILHVVTARKTAEKMAVVVGEISDVDIRVIPSEVTVHHILVTKKHIAGQIISSLNLARRYGVSITRMYRAGLDLVAHPHLKLQLGDRLTVVGVEANIRQVASELGNSVKELNLPNLMVIFLGIILGVIVGSVPIHLPGIPASIKLGLAGGPLVVGILLSYFGKIGPVVSYIPEGANLLLREIGITLFLTSVGIRCGGDFVETLLHGGGMGWMLLGLSITVLPILIVGAFARLFFKTNYLVLCGLLAGSMTDPPALQYASQTAKSDAPLLTYASVYPLTMILRIITAQFLIFFFLR